MWAWHWLAALADTHMNSHVTLCSLLNNISARLLTAAIHCSHGVWTHATLYVWPRIRHWEKKPGAKTLTLHQILQQTAACSHESFSTSIPKWMHVLYYRWKIVWRQWVEEFVSYSSKFRSANFGEEHTIFTQQGQGKSGFSIKSLLCFFSEFATKIKLVGSNLWVSHPNPSAVQTGLWRAWAPRWPCCQS